MIYDFSKTYLENKNTLELSDVDLTYPPGSCLKTP